MPEISEAQTQEQLQQVRTLFREYHSELPKQLKLANFDREVEGLPGEYSPPKGSLLLATVAGQPAGCVGLRPFPRLEGACEMKRLYVRPAFRSYGLGRKLIDAVIHAARDAGYAALRLDTLASMEAAQRLYRELGFVEIPAYNNSHLPGTRFYELALDAHTPT